MANLNHLTHWGRVTFICVGKLTIIGSDNGLSPDRRQAIIWTNAGLLLIGPLGTNFSEILIEILTFSFRKMCLNVSSAKWRPFCFGLNVLILQHCIFHWVQSNCWKVFSLFLGSLNLTCFPISEFTGDGCQFVKDSCFRHNCVNGATCQPHATSYDCLCIDGNGAINTTMSCWVLGVLLGLCWYNSHIIFSRSSCADIMTCNFPGIKDIQGIASAYKK